ncbi:hypothetical protein U9M48_033658 [Paspalum notatum var. saurae]|uniref:Uncharacterized protein n=1 Tax=Paspalum notatum var. saurae TaxID=547442 RepID=A0AAQ3UAM6_PASNO
MERSEEPTIEIKLFVDMEKRRVLFAEADKDFVDVLFSWLTLPLGTIARLLGKQSQMGCLDHVYRSVDLRILARTTTKPRPARGCFFHHSTPPPATVVNSESTSMTPRKAQSISAGTKAVVLLVVAPLARFLTQPADAAKTCRTLGTGQRIMLALLLA